MRYVWDAVEIDAIKNLIHNYNHHPLFHFRLSVTFCLYHAWLALSIHVWLHSPRAEISQRLLPWKKALRVQQHRITLSNSVTIMRGEYREEEEEAITEPGN